MARRRVHNIAAIVKAYEAEAKRAKRCGHDDDAAALLRYAAAAATQPAQGDAVEATVKPSRAKRTAIVAPCLVVVDEWSHLPTDQAAWARELMRREAADIVRREEVDHG
jgi:uncharacterized protein YlxW (UPF0749 family)